MRRAPAGDPLPQSVQSRLPRHAADYALQSARIRELDQERRALLRSAKTERSMAKVSRMLELEGVGIETSLGSGTDVPHLPPCAREARPSEGARPFLLRSRHARALGLL